MYNKIILANGTNEEIIDIPNTNSRYGATRSGKIWSYPKKQGKDMYLSRGKFLSPSIASGYKRVTLTVGKKKVSYSVHRLIAITFLNNKENTRTVNHIDGDKLNNNVSNLEWATYSENHKHAFKNGLMKISDRCKEQAKKNIHKAVLKNRKLSIDDASEICEAYDTGLFSCRELSIPFKVSTKTINNLVRGVSYVA